jgi:YesN/AraC family two-component response regulator
MKTTHNKVDEAIKAMELIVSKGQSGSKNQRQRLIRAVLRWMRREQRKPITLKEVWGYFWLWLKSKFKSSNKEQEVLNGEENREPAEA